MSNLFCFAAFSVLDFTILQIPGSTKFLPVGYQPATWHHLA